MSCQYAARYALVHGVEAVDLVLRVAVDGHMDLLIELVDVELAVLREGAVVSRGRG